MSLRCSPINYVENHHGHDISETAHGFSLRNHRDKKFSLYHTANNLSKLVGCESQYSIEQEWFEVPWKLKIHKLDDFCFLSVVCGQNMHDARKWSFSAEIEFKMVSSNGKRFRKTEKFLVKTLSKNMVKFMKWDEVEKDFLAEDSVRIEAHVKIFEIKEISQQGERCFQMTHTFKNLNRFEEEEMQYSDVEEWFEIPWRICIQKQDELFGCSLKYDRDLYTEYNWDVKGTWMLYLTSEGSTTFLYYCPFDFKGPGSGGYKNFLRWENLTKCHSLDDSVTVVVRVEITSITKSLVENNPDSKKFVLWSPFCVSNIEDGKVRVSRDEQFFNATWKIEIHRWKGFLGTVLVCKEKTCNTKKVALNTNIWFKLVSANGRSLTRRIEKTIKGEVTTSFPKLIRWDDMQADYMVNGWVDVEVHVEILSITGAEIDETQSLDNLQSSISGLVLNEEVYHTRSFHLCYLSFKVSSFINGQEFWSITHWRRIRVRKMWDFLEIFLYCNKELCMISNWSIETECTFRLVSPNGKIMKQTSKLVFQKPGGQGISRFIRWSDMIAEYSVDDHIIIDADVKIEKIQEYSLETPTNEKRFSMSHTIRNVSSMEEGSEVFSRSEEWYGVLWSISMKNYKGFAALMLNCEDELSEKDRWAIQASYQLSLVYSNGKSFTDYFEYIFETAGSNGKPKLITWVTLLSLLTDDSVTIEARVIFIKEIDSSPKNTFSMSHSVRSLSNMKEGEYHFSITEIHSDIPWRISVKKDQMCILVYLHCDKFVCNDEHWSAQTEVQLMLVSETGRTLTDRVTHIFERPEGICWTKRLKWEDLERDFMVDDSVRIEARVKLVESKEVDNEVVTEANEFIATE